MGDQWYPSLADAEAVCALHYGIEIGDWQPLDDPMDGCQHDWIAPVRVKGHIDEQSPLIQLERLEGGVWVDVFSPADSGRNEDPSRE